MNKFLFLGILFTNSLTYLIAINSFHCPGTDGELDPCNNDDKYQRLVLPYGACAVVLGNYSNAKEQPSVFFANADDSQVYLLVMVDPDAPSKQDPKFKYFRHWILFDIPGGLLKTNGNLQDIGTTLTTYMGPNPPSSSGLHRYQFFLFVQPDYFGSLYNSDSLVNTGRGAWDLDDLVSVNELCPHLVATYEFSTSKL